MLRSVALGVALSVLAAACALVEHPLPTGTVELHVQFHNVRAQPVALTVRTPNGVLPGAVRPASLPANTMSDVTFYPPPGQWWIEVNGSSLGPRGNDMSSVIRADCSALIVLDADGGFSVDCE